MGKKFHSIKRKDDMNDFERSKKAMDLAWRYRGETDGKLNDPSPYGIIRDIFPDYVNMTEEYLLADVMARPGLTLREHSMVIIATLVAIRFEGVRGHMNWALNIGISREEVAEIMMHVGQRAGWPVGIEIFKLIEDAYPGYLAKVKEMPLAGILSGPRLSTRELSMLDIAVYTACRFGERLEGELRQALNIGISEETLLEVIMQATPFAGWQAGVQALRAAKKVFSSEGGKQRLLTRDGDRKHGLRSSERGEKGRNIIQELQGDVDEENVFGFLGEVCPDFLRVITEEHLFGEVWSRPGLGLRDRAMITLAVLIAFRCREELKSHMGYALNAGVSQEEIKEIIMQVANYTCWGSGVQAAQVAGEVFSRKG
jgi:4-carboxymuconolactone decarboxylase